MIKKHLVLIGVIISLAFLFIAIALYPGGSMFEKDSAGFSFTNNFISNLFGAKALNGADSPSCIWAFIAMFFLPLSYAVFFIHMAKKLPQKGIRYILQYCGVANIICMFLIVTPLHDLMLNISISLFWMCIGCITGFILKSNLYLFKFLCILCLLIFYYSLYLWATNNWNLLPVMQKLNFINSTLLILAMEYFTSAKDFAHIKSGKQKVVNLS